MMLVVPPNPGDPNLNGPLPPEPGAEQPADRDNAAGDARSTITLTIRTTETAARDLPFGMAYDVGLVLEACGLNVLDESLKGSGMVAVQLALVKVIQAIPDELGGRLNEVQGSIKREVDR
ncbi:hypothetical protein E0H73_43120 [Kribbella pittospori]|uniref:Uncharacterized protein n=1 Tax=Kribbella pittospori TaxID=722689 RepID=A0A4R0JLM3_9ACTN|nr:hypothetical protein [Kribbella pittospori]TCC48073.1 hypothetical protein E0H73_43120 [Kribbella pittospori]